MNQDAVINRLAHITGASRKQVIDVLGGFCGIRGIYNTDVNCDYNTLTTTGLYIVNSNNDGKHTNVPVNRSARAYLLVFSILPQYMVQIWIDTQDKSNLSAYIRGFSSSSWGNWKTITLT